jgi:dimethylglycine dehydrogenase
MGSYYLRAWHMRWFHDHRTEGVEVTDISDRVVGFSLSGPNARKVLERVTDQDVGHAAMPFMACRRMDVGLARAHVARMSVAGELGFEINVDAADHVGLRRTLMQAGADLGLSEYGYYALNSLRLEKSFGIWSREFTWGYTPGMTGMDRWIDWAKGDFVGRKAAMAERDGNGPGLKLATLRIEADGADASGFEPVWSAGRRVGYVTSGGYGHTLGQSLAMALLEPGLCQPGTPLSVHVVGVERQAQVIAPSPYDPDGKAMRA